MTISVVIPSYNGKEILKSNLTAVIDACAHWSSDKKHWEIIVVDDGSSDDSVVWLKDNHPVVKVVENKKNLRFAKTVNRGISEAKGNVVVLLNNDVKPNNDFLKPLLKHFDDKLVFAVGCLEKNGSWGSYVLGGRGVGEFSRGFLVHSRARDQSRNVTLWVSGGSGAFRKDIWNKLGGFDPMFRPAYEEDRDLSYNALKAGFKVVFEPKSVVFHNHETTNRKFFGESRIKIYSFKNQLLFVWKNISDNMMVLNHIFWIPYHLIVTTFRTKGLFFISLLMALAQVFEVIRSRKRASKMWKLNDKEILAGHIQ